MRLAQPASTLPPRLACLLAALLATACEPLAPSSSQPASSTAQLSLRTSAGFIAADFFTTATLTVTATSSSGPPPAGRVFLTTNKGRFVGSRVGSTGQVVVVDLFSSNSGTAQVQCASPEGEAVVGTMTITARSAGGDQMGDAVSNPVNVECFAARDWSEVHFVAPQDGDVFLAPYVQDFRLRLVDFHGGPLEAPAMVRVESLDGVALQVTAPDSNRRFVATSANVPVQGGDAVFWMQRPGDLATRHTPIPFRLAVSFTNRAGATTTAVGNFTWGPSDVPDLSGAFITQVSSASPGVVQMQQLSPPRVLVHAGQQDAWVEFLVSVVDWDGVAWETEQDVTITCLPDDAGGAASRENCRALTGRDPAPGGVLQLEHTSQVVVTAVPSPAGATGPSTQAVVRYRVPATSVPGTVRLSASMVLPAGGSVTNDQAKMAVVSLVDEDSLTVSSDAVPLDEVPQAYQVSLRTYEALQPTSGVLVCAVLDDVGAAFAFLDDLQDDVGGSTLVMPVDGDGVASFQVRPRPTSMPGTVRVDFTVARVPYTAALDDNALTNQRQVCASLTGATVVTGSETFTLGGR